MDEPPFFTRDGDAYLPGAACRGPWDPRSLHGRLIVGLIGARIEARHGDPDFTPARLTVDMYRLPGLDRAHVTTRVVKDGWRLKVVEAEFLSGGVPMARASCQFLRRTPAPHGEVWSPPAWSVPAPDDIAAPSDPRDTLGGMWAVRPIVGAMGDRGPRRLWMAEVRALVEGEDLSPFARAALAADFASPFANAGDAGLAYINSDVTLYLHRPPAGEWIGMEVVNHHASDGVAIAECWLHDKRGAIGSASAAALARGTKRIGA
ncbi:MAG: thioesterase family protein [Caulobacteraceae bacterium]|nr:thioesterase family protein [Caulobacteraceae bacterium]